MGIWGFKDARLALLRHLDEKRQRQRRFQQALAKSMRSFEHGIARIKFRASSVRRHSLNTKSRASSHSRNLGFIQAWERFNACHLPNQFTQYDYLCGLAVEELVYDVLENWSEISAIPPEQHSSKGSKT